VVESPASKEKDQEEKGPIWIFPSWAWVYGTVLVYGILTIIGLWILTRLLDPAA
jgi:hypothetical protein